MSEKYFEDTEIIDKVFEAVNPKKAMKEAKSLAQKAVEKGVKSEVYELAAEALTALGPNELDDVDLETAREALKEIQNLVG